MIIFRRYNYTTKICAPVENPDHPQKDPHSVRLHYQVLDESKQPITTKGGRYLDPYNYTPHPEEHAMIAAIQAAVGDRYQVQSVCNPKAPHMVFFEVVLVVAYEREIGEIEL